MRSIGTRSASPGRRRRFPLDIVCARRPNPRMNDGEPREILTAADVARFCDVDLNTIHKWAERGEVRYFKTPGRHLRFRRVDVLDFLRKYGYPIPETLVAGKPLIIVIDDAASLGSVKRKLSMRFEVSTFQDPLDALITVGNEMPDGVVLDLALPAFDGLRCLARLKQLPTTRHIRTVVFSADEERKRKALDAGASAFVTKPDVARLKATLEALMGLERL